MVLVVQKGGGERDDARDRVVVQDAVHADGPFFHDGRDGRLGAFVRVDNLKRAAHEDAAGLAELHGPSVAEEQLGAENSRSSAATCLLRAGCVMCSAFAASV